jgi:hypothetical protein
MELGKCDVASECIKQRGAWVILPCPVDETYITLAWSFWRHRLQIYSLTASLYVGGDHCQCTRRRHKHGVVKDGLMRRLHQEMTEDRAMYRLHDDLAPEAWSSRFTRRFQWSLAQQRGHRHDSSAPLRIQRGVAVTYTLTISSWRSEDVRNDLSTAAKSQTEIMKKRHALSGAWPNCTQFFERHQKSTPAYVVNLLIRAHVYSPDPILISDVLDVTNSVTSLTAYME